MDNEIVYLGETIIEKKYEIARTVHNIRLKEISEDQLFEIKLEEDEIIHIRANFIELFGESLKIHEQKDIIFKNFTTWGNETGMSLCNQNIPLDEALKDSGYYRKYIWKVIKEEMIKHNMSIETVFEVKEIIDPLLDHAVHSFSLAYVKSYTESFKNARRSFLELSVPVVPITDNVAILPLIGDIDTERAKLLLEDSLTKSKQLGIQHLIIDISGVSIIDTMVANELMKTINSLKLLGVETIFTGIRPEIAQTIVGLGLDLAELTFMGSLKQALENLKAQNVI